MGALLQDLKHGLRILAKSPGFTSVAVLTLALGIGASTAVFSIVNAVLLKALPYPHAEQIVFPWRQAPVGWNLGYNEIQWGLTEFRLLLRDSKTFQELGAFKSDSFILTGTGEPVRLDGLRASAGFFPALGVQPALGRAFSLEEDTPGQEHEVLLSYGLWREKFGADPGVLGRAITLNGEVYTVSGVMPAGFSFPRKEEMPGSFEFPREAALWVPLALPAALVHPDDPDELAVIGRMKPGVTIEQAQGEMNVLTKRLDTENPRSKGWNVSRVKPLARQVVGDTERPLLLLFAAIGVVLLIACANVANLILMRSVGRQREFTLRAALGAGRARIVRQVLTESIVLAFAGGVLGIALGEAGVYFVKAFGPASLPRLHEVTLDARVFFFALGITLITGILFGLVPALGAANENLAESLKEGGQRSGGSHAGSRMRNALLVSEVALALVLVIAASLLVRTFVHMLKVDPGFNPARVLTFELSLPGAKYGDTDHIVGLYQNTLERLRNVPGVESAGLVRTVPMGGAADSTGIRFPGHAVTGDKIRPYAEYTMVSPGYFSAVGTPLLRGPDFLESDSSDSQPVTIISKAMAKQYWPGEDPIGKQVGPGSARYSLLTIVGIAADVKHLSVREDPGPEMYVLYNQKPWPSLLTMQFALRTKADPAAVTAGAREAIRSLDPDLPIAKVASLETVVDASMTQPRFTMILLAIFGVVALVLASVGIYGVISYAVAQRTRELGIRLALGAQRGNVFGMILGQGIRVAGLGVFLGLVGAAAITRVMDSLLYGVQATDPLTFVAVPLLLLGVALAACYVPARRAMRVDPMVALRYE
ncbi:MAG: ABC transporter permease [Candidatus Acidiferrales bacterium]